jgi:purine nucleosidase
MDSNNSNECWLIDTDYSYDDQLALSYLIPRLNIIAITVNAVNTNATSFQIKKKLEEDLTNKYSAPYIKVYAGSENPFIDYQKELKDDPIINPYNPKEVDFSNFPKEDIGDIQDKLSNLASVKIAEAIRIYEKKLNILTLGPLTNLSLAILIDSTIKDKFNQLYIAGGSFNNFGNSGNCAEYNFRADPVACKNVIFYYRNITLIPLEIDLENNMFGLLASIVATQSHLIKKKEILPSDIDITGRLSRGGMIIEKYGYLKSGKLNDVTIIQEVDQEELNKLAKEYII